MRLQARAYAGIVVALYLCAHAVMAYVESRGLGDYHGAGYAVQRFREVRSAVTPGMVLGYVTDVPDDAPGRSTWWAVARYAVAPALLDPHPGSAQLLLADLKHPAEATQFLARTGYVVERDFGNGVLLLRPRR